MKPEIHVLGISLKSFGIVFACGFIAAGAILVRRLRELGKPVDYSYEMAFAALVGGLVGSRVYYVVQNYSLVKHDLLGSLFSGSGLVWYGGVIGGALGGDRVGEMARITVARAARPRQRPAGDRLRDRTDRLPGVGRRRLRHPFHAADLDELSPRHGPDATRSHRPADADLRDRDDGAVAWWLWRMRDRFRPGALFAFYLLLSGTERLLIEFIRRNHKIVLDLTAPQLESIVLMIAGLVWLQLLRRRGGSGSAMAVAGARLDEVRPWRPPDRRSVWASAATFVA